MSTRWSKADLHIHTTYSDGYSSVAQVLEYTASQTELRVIAITDHDTITGALEARRLAASYNIDVIVGEEVSTADGHLLALFIEHWLPPGRPASETIAAIHAQGGLAIAAHPCNWLSPSFGRSNLRSLCVGAARAWPVDAIESFNASLLFASMNYDAIFEAATLGLPAIGASDSHHLATIGTGYTLFPGTTAAELRQALLAGQTRVAGERWGPVRLAQYVRLLLSGETGKLARLAARSVGLAR